MPSATTTHSSNGSTDVNGKSSLPAAHQAAIDACRPNLLKQRLDQRLLSHSLSVRFVTDPEIAVMAADAGFQGILVDLEHSTLDLSDAARISCACLQAGITPIVRVPTNSSEWISRVLDGGAQAVIVPHVNSVEDAQNVVRYAKFHPLGERSATSGLPLFKYRSPGAKFGNVVANEATLVIVMIETERALEVADDIAMVEGVDMILIGTNDLSADMGIPGDYDHPKIAAAYHTVASAIHKASKATGTVKSLGIGGLNSRLDILEKLTMEDEYQVSRYIMSATDSPILLAGFKSKVGQMNAISSKLEGRS